MSRVENKVDTKKPFNKNLFIIIGIIIILLLVAVLVSKLLQKNKKTPSKKVNKKVQQIKKLLKINPFDQKVNPFKSVKTNPFK